MYVKVDVSSGETGLAEADDFTRFHVAAPGASASEVVAVLGDDARPLGDDHVWVSVDAVRRWAAPTAGAGWDDGFAKMLDYAASKGWTDDDRTHIQAHIESA